MRSNEVIERKTAEAEQTKENTNLESDTIQEDTNKLKVNDEDQTIEQREEDHGQIRTYILARLSLLSETIF